MPNDLPTDASKTEGQLATRRRYEAPRLERKRSVARVTLASTGNAQTTTTTVLPP